MIRRLAVVLLVVLAALVFGGAVALAESLPQEVAEADLLRVQLAQARAELAERALMDARRAVDEAAALVRVKYKIREADTVDVQTRVIKRVPKTPTKPEAR